MEQISVITAFLNAIAILLVWATNTWWSKKFADAKNAEITALKSAIDSLKAAQTETVRAKNAEIIAIKQNTPEKIRDAFQATNQIMEDTFGKLRSTLEETNNKVIDLEKLKTEKQSEIADLAIAKQQYELEILNLKKEIMNLNEEKEEILIENEYLRPLAEETEARQAAYEDAQWSMAKDERYE
jgi:predicted  nucleic acid-binding Zn-ribbon protein